jgi:hypothetical protein
MATVLFADDDTDNFAHCARSFYDEPGGAALLTLFVESRMEVSHELA